jgi:hypothetical protein
VHPDVRSRLQRGRSDSEDSTLTDAATVGHQAFERISKALEDVGALSHDESRAHAQQQQYYEQQQRQAASSGRFASRAAAPPFISPGLQPDRFPAQYYGSSPMAMDVDDGDYDWTQLQQPAARGPAAGAGEQSFATIDVVVELVLAQGSYRETVHLEDVLPAQDTVGEVKRRVLAFVRERSAAAARAVNSAARLRLCLQGTVLRDDLYAGSAGIVSHNCVLQLLDEAEHSDRYSARSEGLFYGAAFSEAGDSVAAAAALDAADDAELSSRAGSGLNIHDSRLWLQQRDRQSAYSDADLHSEADTVRGQAAAARSAVQRLRPEEARFYALERSFLQQEENVADRSPAAMSDTAGDAAAAAAAAAADSIEQALTLVRGYSTALVEQCAALDARAQQLAAAVAVAGVGGSAAAAAAAARREAVRAGVLRTESDTWELLVAVLSAREDDKAIAQQIANKPGAVLAENTTLKPSASDEEVRDQTSVCSRDFKTICMILHGVCAW